MVKIKFSDYSLARYVPDKGEVLVDKELRNWGSSLGDASVEYTFDPKMPGYRMVPATQLYILDNENKPNFIIRRDSIKPVHGHDIILRRDIVQYPFLPIKIDSPLAERAFFKHFADSKHNVSGYEAIIKPIGAKIVEESSEPEKHFQNGIYLNTRPGYRGIYNSPTLDLIIQNYDLYYGESSENKLVDYLREQENLNAYAYDGDWSIIDPKNKSDILRFDKVLSLILKFLGKNSSNK